MRFPQAMVPMQGAFQGMTQGQHIVGEVRELAGKELSIAFAQPGHDPCRQGLTGQAFAFGGADHADPPAPPGRVDAPDDEQGLAARVGDRAVSGNPTALFPSFAR